MRIGVDASCWRNPRGYGRFTRELLTELIPHSPEDTFVLFADQATLEVIDLKAPNVRLVPVKQTQAPAEAASADGNRSPLDMLRFTHAVWRETLSPGPSGSRDRLP